MKVLAILLALCGFAGAQTYKFSTLVNFPATAKKGPQYPSGSLAIDTAGNLYGVSLAGGKFTSASSGATAGTVFKVTPKGVLTAVYNFAGGNDGFEPYQMVRDSKGNFYGVNYSTQPDGNGFFLPQLFKVAAGKESNVGLPPTYYLDVNVGSSGSLFGYAMGGDDGQAELFQITSGKVSNMSDLGWGLMYGPPIQDKAGNFFGMDFLGSTYAVFELSTKGVLTTLHTFDEGQVPSKLTQDAIGNKYGTTFDGTIFKLDATGAYSLLYTFCALPNCTDGQGPSGSVSVDSAGNLYGTTQSGGSLNFGVVYKITPSGQESVLLNAGAGKAGPSVVLDKSGNIYGYQEMGGPSHNGSIFKLTKN